MIINYCLLYLGASGRHSNTRLASATSRSAVPQTSTGQTDGIPRGSTLRYSSHFLKFLNCLYVVFITFIKL